MMARLLNLIAFGKVTVVDDGEDLQLLQVTEKAYGRGFVQRILDKVPRLTDFGFTSVPPIDAEVVMIRRNGDRGLSLVIATSHRESRPRDLEPGDSALYDVRGAIIKLTADGLDIDCAGLPARIHNATTVTIEATEKVRLEAPTIELEAADLVHLKAPEIRLEGPVKATSTIEAEGEVTARDGGTEAKLGQLRDAYQAHKHGGVDTGSGTSGVSDHLV